ncbi:hypothetical protein WJX75_001567 [Coccomyxa subellipsoidea]|uniref:Nodulin-like domain-containing protein n=1 Tax=Coccomyxa subellipsoidea TaxID=248742 RepID=A0ABR2YWT1_9CHLO
MLCAGLSYSYGIWSSTIKERYQLSQLEVAGIGTAGNIGGYLAIFAGLFYDWTRRMNRFGPRATLLVGVGLHFLGYMTLWAAAHGNITPPYWALLIITFGACNAQTWFETGSMVTSIRNFDTERGTVIGILKAFLGLSGSFFTTVYVSFLDPDAVSFLMMLAVVPSAIVLTCLCFVNYVPYIQVEPHTKSHAFHLACTTVLGLAAYQAVIALARNSEGFDFWGGVLMTGANATLLFPMLAIPIIFGGLRSRRLRDLSPPEEQQAAQAVDLLPELQPFLADDDASDSPVNIYRDKSPARCLRSQSFWYLFFASAVCSGAGLTLLNNTAQMVEALGGGTSTAVFVSVYSIANCLGRLCSGFLPDRMMSERDMPRTVSLIFLSALTFVACLLNAFARLEFFGISAAVTGFAFGGFQGVVPAIASEIFGLRNLATNYSLLQLGPALCSYVQATYLAGTLYARAMERHHETGLTCHGSDCFQTVFLINAGLSLGAVVMSTLLWRRTKHLYSRVIEVTKAERAKRGLRGEFEEARQLIKRMGAENKLMHAILSRGRSLVGDLQGAMPGGNAASPPLQSAVDALSGFLADARRLLDEQAALYRRFDELPNWRKGLTG